MPVKNKKNAGFSLVEIAIVLAVIGLIIGGIMLAYSAVVTKRNIQTTTDDIHHVRDGLKSLYAYQGIDTSCASFTDCNLIKLAVNAGILPDDMKISWGEDRFDPNFGTNLWNGGFDMWYATLNRPNTGARYDAIFMVIDSLPINVCAKLAVNLIQAETDVIYYDIGGTGGSSPPPYGNDQPLTVETAAKNCASQGNKAYIAILYMLR